MASALASLNANYTDSEGEDGGPGSEGEGGERGGLHPSLAERLGKLGEAGSTGSGTPASNTSSPGLARGRSNNGTPSKKAKLVSYLDPDADLSDDDQSVPMELASDDDDKENDNFLQEVKVRRCEDDPADAVVQENGTELTEGEGEKEKSHIMEELWEGGVQLPPDPSGRCSKELQDKIEQLLAKKLERGQDYNSIISNKKNFRNPSIYEKLILHLDIDELGTNFPPELYDGHLFGKESYYTELAKVQMVEMDRREKALEAKKKLGDNRLKDSHHVQHRKSKWDQPGPGGARGGPSSKPLSIPAYGSLKKK